MRRGIPKVAALLGPGALAAGDYYNQMVLRGLVRAGIDLGVAFDMVISPTRERIAEDLDRCCLSEEYRLVLAAGNEMQAAVADSARRFPSQRFALLDGTVARARNVVSYSSDPRSIAFVCGGFASLRGEAVGCVLWSDNPVAREWIGGFAAGAHYACRTARVYYSFAAAAKEAHDKAALQFGRGASVIMCHAGSADAGIFQAAGENGGRLLGFLDGRRADPEHVILDVVRRLEPAVLDAVRTGVAKKFEGGSSVRMGLEEDGFALDLDNAHESVTAADKRRISRLVSGIVRGDFQDLLRGPGWPGASSSGATRV